MNMVIILATGYYNHSTSNKCVLLKQGDSLPIHTAGTNGGYYTATLADGTLVDIETENGVLA